MRSVMPYYRTTPRVCPHCQQVFPARFAYLRFGRDKYCSQTCYLAYIKAARDARFWAKVEKTDTCWLWLGKRRHGGYGVLTRDGKEVSAHRISYEMHYGPIPDGLWILHICDNPPCVRPDHLRAGTTADNMHDMVAKGRAGWIVNPAGRARGDRNGVRLHPECLRYGAANHATKLTDEDVRAIRTRYHRGGIRQKDLGAEYGVSQAVISAIVLGKTWRQLL